MIYSALSCGSWVDDAVGNFRGRLKPTSPKFSTPKTAMAQLPMPKFPMPAPLHQAHQHPARRQKLVTV